MNQKLLAVVLVVVIVLAAAWLMIWRRQSPATVENVLPTTPPPGFGSGAPAAPAAPGR